MPPSFPRSVGEDRDRGVDHRVLGERHHASVDGVGVVGVGVVGVGVVGVGVAGVDVVARCCCGRVGCYS